MSPGSTEKGRALCRGQKSDRTGTNGRCSCRRGARYLRGFLRAITRGLLVNTDTRRNTPTQRPLGIVYAAYASSPFVLGTPALESRETAMRSATASALNALSARW